MTADLSPRPRGSVKGKATRNHILDACEILFARNGYLGTSLRDIAAEAGVRMGVVHYHFGNKHLIMDAALERKLGLLRQTIADSYARADAVGRPLTIEETVNAFIHPFLHSVSLPDDPLRNYIVMTSHLMSYYRLPELRPVLAKLSVISSIFIERLRLLYPGTSQESLLAGVYFVEAALIFMVQDPGFLDDISNGHHSAAKLEAITRQALLFFSSGLHGMIEA